MTVTPKKEKKEEEDSKKDVKDGKETKGETEEKEVKKDPLILTLEDIREHCQLLERSVVRTESRYTTPGLFFERLFGVLPSHLTPKG